MLDAMKQSFKEIDEKREKRSKEIDEGYEKRTKDQRRFVAAVAAMQGYLANGAYTAKDDYRSMEQIAAWSTKQADALLKELEK